MFQTPVKASYTVSVLDVSGRLVRQIYSGFFEPGSHTVRWDGVDATGGRVQAGTYFCVVTGAGNEIARKVVVIP